MCIKMSLQKLEKVCLLNDNSININSNILIVEWPKLSEEERRYQG